MALTAFEPIVYFSTILELKSLYLLEYQEFFHSNKRKIAVEPTIHQNSAVSKGLVGKMLKSLIINIDLES